MSTVATKATEATKGSGGPANDGQRSRREVDVSDFTLALPPELLEAIAKRVAELLAERQPETAPELLTVTEAAEFLRCGRQRIYDLVSQGRVPCLRDGSRLLFRRVDLLAYLDQGTA